MSDFIQNLKNYIDFYLRKKFYFSRKNYSEENEEKDCLVLPAGLAEREKKLFEKFELEDLKSNSTRANYLENLYMIDILDKFFDVDFKDNLNVLDIGCKNWFYAKGEYSFFKNKCEKLNITGVELDANRLYTNLYSRAEVANFHIKDLVGAKYIAADFLDIDDKYDYMVWILPFVVEYPHIKWGLPKKYFQPEIMLLHAHNLLKKEGKILIINQGEAEYEVQKSLCDKLDLKYTQIGEIKSGFCDYKYRRYATIIENI